MNREEAIEIHSDEEGQESYVNRRSILEPAIRSVVDALGGYEGGRYRLGDECYGCLKDLKKFWRRDDTDDERTVARIFWETRLLPNDLVPILLETAGRGDFEDKRAVACVDLITAMTWPIDLAEELQELDEVDDKGTDYTQLLSSHLHYKNAMLQPEVIQALLGIALFSIAKTPKERKPRDISVMNVILYLIRNLAFIKDPPSNTHLSADRAQLSTMQSRLIKLLSEQEMFPVIMTLASNAGTDPIFNNWNTLILEILYLLYRGVKPSSLARDQAKEVGRNLSRLLAIEDERRKNYNRNASTRHSRFGTTIAVSLNPKKAQRGATETADAETPEGSRAFVLHKQQAIHRDAGNLLDMASSKRKKTQKGKKIDELGREDNLSVDAKSTLQGVAKQFLEACFNHFMASLLKDIKAERPKITEKDHLRLLFVTKWFLEFFLCTREEDKERKWDYGLISEVTDRSWFVWILKRMRESVEDKPKRWTELQAGIECLTQLILLVDAMCSSSSGEVSRPARILQQQIIYNGEVLDIALESMRAYKEGTQSLVYLTSSVHMAYALLRMLEKWNKGKGGDETLVRRKVKKKRTKGKRGEDGEVPDVEEEEEEESEEEIHETMFTFDSFEQRFAHPDVTQTLLAYLARYEDFGSAEEMKRVVNLLHRQVVRAKAEGLFFKVSTLDLFKSILTDKSLPKEQPYKDLVALINFVLRKFFKAVEEDSFVIVQAFFPKNRGQWKHFSSWEPEQKPAKADKMEEDTRFPPDVQVKKGHSWSEQLGIAMACLVDNGQKNLIDWVLEILTFVTAQKLRIIEDTDGSTSNVNLEDPDNPTRDQGPSSEAMSQFKDYMIPYVNDEQADAATKNPHLKLMFRLVHFFNYNEDGIELEWCVPAAILPSDLQQSINVINGFLENPLDLNGKKAEQLLQKKRRKRRRRRSPSPSDDGLDPLDEPRKKKKEKRKKEEKSYKSAQFIEDSDAEAGDMEAFFEKEKALRQRTALAALASGAASGTMKAQGTKKRRKKNTDEGGGKKKRKRKTTQVDDGDKTPVEPEIVISDSDSDENPFDPFASPKQPDEPPKARPRPRPLYGKDRANSKEHDPPPSQDPPGLEVIESDSPLTTIAKPRKKIVMISDDDDE